MLLVICYIQLSFKERAYTYTRSSMEGRVRYRSLFLISDIKSPQSAVLKRLVLEVKKQNSFNIEGSINSKGFVEITI